MSGNTDVASARLYVQPTTSTITWANRWDHFLARCGVRRNSRRVGPVLYALGNPTPDSPVFVTANYRLSFDALRSALTGIDGYILVLFPILLPCLPTRDFSSKGLILGGLVALPFALVTFLNNPEATWWRQVGGVLASLLTMPPATAYLALNFTGSTTFTSRSGVRREIFTYIPIMAWMFGGGTVLKIVLSLI